jgi:hypothetical protein
MARPMQWSGRQIVIMWRLSAMSGARTRIRRRQPLWTGIKNVECLDVTPCSLCHNAAERCLTGVGLNPPLNPRFGPPPGF